MSPLPAGFATCPLYNRDDHGASYQLPPSRQRLYREYHMRLTVFSGRDAR